MIDFYKKYHRSDVHRTSKHLLNDCCNILIQENEKTLFLECPECNTVYFKKELLGGEKSMTNLENYASGQFLNASMVKEEYEGQELTIESEQMREMNDGEKKPVIGFEEIEPELVLNKTNTKKLIDRFDSADSEEWIGEVVELTTVEVNFNGELTDSIRISD